jgi:DNA-binding HxlR family transcriptional regulator
MSSDEVFEAVSHPLRVKIIEVLAKGPMRFADLKRELRIDSSGLLDFHLRKLDDLVSINNEGLYVLNEKGFAALQAVEAFSRYGWQRRAFYINLLFHIITNFYVLLKMAEWLPLTLAISATWMTFYSYWTFFRRHVSLKPK